MNIIRFSYVFSFFLSHNTAQEVFSLVVVKLIKVSSISVCFRFNVMSETQREEKNWKRRFKVEEIIKGVKLSTLSLRGAQFYISS